MVFSYDDKVLIKNPYLLKCYGSVNLWSSAVLTSTHHHSKFIPDALGHVKPVKIGGAVIVEERGGSKPP